jgi:hypothetical protein
MMRTVLVLAVVLAVSGCATPSVTKERMTLGEANISGLDCRREKPPGTNMPRTVCASPEAWEKFDAAARYENDLAFQKARSSSNAGAFNRQ